LRIVNSAFRVLPLPSQRKPERRAAAHPRRKPPTRCCSEPSAETRAIREVCLSRAACQARPPLRCVAAPYRWMIGQDPRGIHRFRNRGRFRPTVGSLLYTL
jgi:hypothetical protein